MVSEATAPKVRLDRIRGCSMTLFFRRLTAHRYQVLIPLVLWIQTISFNTWTKENVDKDLSILMTIQTARKPESDFALTIGGRDRQPPRKPGPLK